MRGYNDSNAMHFYNILTVGQFSRKLSQILYGVHFNLFFLKLLIETVAKALVLSGDPAVQETAKFVTMFDKFFDALKVSNYTPQV